MSDIIDLGNERAQQFIDAALENRRETRQLAPSGVCHNPLCTDDLDNAEALYCGPECASEHQRLMDRGRV